MKKKNHELDEDDQRLNNIGGWLAFFIFISIIVSPIVQIATTFIEYVSFLEVIEGLGMASLFILVGVFLWKKKPYAVQFSKIVLITTLTINIFMFILGELMFSPMYVLGPIVWILFLYNSRRVEVVYKNLKEDKSGFQIWPILAIIYALISPIFAIIFAIVALINISKNKKLKGMAISIIALIVAILYFLISVILYAIFYSSIDYVPEYIETDCSNYCYDVDSAREYYVDYDYFESGFVCYCLDIRSNILDQKFYAYNP